jgi:tRNA dimethylallyltransferase
MLASGLIEEVQELYDREDLHLQLPSIKSVGYRQVWQYLEGDLDYDAMVERSIIATRQLAKRQTTWLRNWPNLQPLDEPSAKSIDNVLKYLESVSI